MTRWLFTFMSVVTALLGGAYFGAFACGGFPWHRQAFLIVLGATTLAALMVPLDRRRPVLSRLIVVVGVPALFITAQAAAAPFYPAPPDSFEDFLGSLLALESGSC